MGKKVLLVDDDEISNFFNQTFISELDEMNGGEIKVVNDGAEALALLKATEGDQYIFKPDLILLDINMPVMGGFEFLDEYDSFPEAYKEHVKIIMLSTSVHPRDKEKAASISSISGYMAKPLEVRGIQEILAAL